MASLNVLLLPEPGSGHLMSLIEAGKRLLGHGGRSHAHEFTVTVLVVRPPTPESATEVDAHVRRVEASGSTTSRPRRPRRIAAATCRRQSRGTWSSTSRTSGPRRGSSAPRRS